MLATSTPAAKIGVAYEAEKSKPAGRKTPGGLYSETFYLSALAPA
jgi:hypothetical protein